MRVTNHGWAVLALITTINAIEVHAVEAEGSAKSPDAAVLEEVSVTARRQEESLMTVPVSANVVSGAMLSNSAIVDLSSLGSLVPAVNLDKVAQSNVGSLTIRGIGSSGSDASTGQSVATVIDGVATSRGAFLLSGLFDVSQLEVLKGPQALFFGKDAPGGVVSVRSNGPTDALAGYLNLGYETEAHERQLEGAISGPLTDTIRMRVALKASESDGWTRNTATARPNLPPLTRIAGYAATTPGAPFRSNESNSVAGRITIDFKPTETFTATLRYVFDSLKDTGQNAELEVTRCPGGAIAPIYFGIADSTNDCAPNGRGVIGAVQPNVAVSDAGFREGVPYGKYESYLSSLTLDYRRGNVEYTSVTAVADYKRIAVATNLNAYGVYAFYNDQKFNQISQEFRAASSFESAVNFAAGIYLDRIEYDFAQPTLLIPLPADPRNGSFLTYSQLMRGDSKSYSAFAQVRWDITTSLKLDAGARYSEDRTNGTVWNAFVNRNAPIPLAPENRLISGSRRYDNVSPEVTLSWTPVADTLVFLSWRNGYKSGNPSRLGLLPASFTADALFYRPEKIDGYELGLKSRLLEGRMRLTAAAFTYDYTDLQLSTFDTVSFISQTLNAGGVRSKGLEVGLDYKPLPALTLGVAIAYTDARYTQFDAIGCYAGQTLAAGCRANRTQDLAGQPKYRAPKWTGNLNLLYETPAFGSYLAGFSGAMRHSDDSMTSENNNPASFQKAYQVYDAGVHVRNDRWRIALLARNLSDERYVSASLDAPNALPGTVNGIVSRPRQFWVQASYRY